MASTLLGPWALTVSQYGNSNASTGYIGGLVTAATNEFGGATTESWNPASGNVNSMYRAALQYYLLYNSSTAGSANKFLAGGPAGATRLNIYSGGRPSISSMTNLNTYASNLLISFSIPAYNASRASSGYYIDGSAGLASANTYPAVSNTVDYTGCTIYLGLCPTFTAASASGNASWFWFGNYSNPTNLSGLSFVTGSVGATGSGSDLEMADTQIVSGGLYKSLGFKFFIPVQQAQ